MVSILIIKGYQSSFFPFIVVEWTIKYFL